MAKPAEYLEQKHYTFADIDATDDEIRRELVDGVIYDVAAPVVVHQEIVVKIITQLENFLRGRKCEVLVSPSVRLMVRKRDDTVFIPDIVVICQSSKLDPKGKGCKGAPDLVVEVLSPSTAYFDRHLKYNKYLEAGVPEYWIVDPSGRLAEVYILKDGEYKRFIYNETDTLPVHILPGCGIDLSTVFPKEDFDWQDEE